MGSAVVLTETAAGYYQDHNAITLSLHQATLHVVRPMEAKKNVDVRCNGMYC